MNTIREIERINQQELERGLAGTPASWHSQYSQSAWVYVGNLDHRLTEGDMICVLSQYGEIDDFHLVRDEETGKSKGFAFCKYQDARSCVLAVDNFIGIKILDRPLRIDHVDQYKLPKNILEKEEAVDVSKTGLAYEDQDLENGYSLHHGQDLFADSDEEKKELKKEEKKREKEAKKKRKEERARKRAEREERRARKKAKKRERSHRSDREDESSSSSSFSDDEPKDTDPVLEVIKVLEKFYERNTHIKESHGIRHALTVYQHAVEAVKCCPKLASADMSDERAAVLIAALLHDVDDRKYFPDQEDTCFNAKTIMVASKLSPSIVKIVLDMIQLVSASKHGNSVPDWVSTSDKYYYLYPRWCDRLEAVGKRGVLRCYQYNIEQGEPLYSESSPRPSTIEEVWEAATPERFELYQASGGQSNDMISHYYDKLLHVARPPKDSVRNSYLEAKAEEGVQPLLAVCLHFGKTGTIDDEFIRSVVID